MTGGNTAAPIWADFMSRALAVRPELGGEFEVPEGIIQTMIDPATGLTAKNNTGRIELFINGTEPTGAIPVEGNPEDDQYEPAPDTKDINAEPGKPKAPAPQKVTSILSDQPARQNLNDSNYLTFEVCTVTGLLPSESCANTAMRRFKIGREPTNFCPKSVRH
jgi:membrane peptidoglycan carboxypeptidase